MAKSNFLIIYFSQNKLYFHNPGADEFKTLDIGDLIEDLTITNPEELQARVETFVKTSKFKKLPLLIIFAKDLYFSKEIETNLKPEEEQQQINQFLSFVPFDLVYNHKFVKPDHTQIIAINRGLYEPLLRLMQSLGYSLEVVTTEEALHESYGAEEFSLELAQELQESASDLKDFNFVSSTRSSKSKKEKPNPAKERHFEKFEMKQDDKKSSKKRLIILGIVFAGLIMVLIGLIIWTRQQNQQPSSQPQPGEVNSSASQPRVKPQNKQQAEAANTNPAAVESAATASAETATGSAQTDQDLDLAEVSIEVLNGSGIEGRAASVRTELEELGFSQIEVDNTDQISGSKSLVVFGQDIESEIKNLVISALNQTESDFTSKTSAQLDNEVVITLYQ